MDHWQVALSLGLKVVSCGRYDGRDSDAMSERALEEFELIVVLKGEVSLRDDEGRIDVASGHSLLLRPGSRHHSISALSGEPSYYWVRFVPTVSDVKEYQIEIPQVSKVQRNPLVAELFQRLIDEQTAQRSEPLYLALLLAQILYEVSRQPPENKPNRGSSLIERAEAYIADHVSEKVTTAAVAHALHVSPDYLNRVFRRVHEMTITEYIHRRKLVDAASMLCDTTGAVAEIASQCGYRSAGHFRRMFERYQGISPGAYRRMMARGAFALLAERRLNASDR
jgi:AraC-like DNA-binding protein